MIDIIISALVVVGTFYYKQFFPAGLWDKKTREAMIICITFGLAVILCLLYFILTSLGWIPAEAGVAYYKVMLMAVGGYEVVYKQILVRIFASRKK